MSAFRKHTIEENRQTCSYPELSKGQGGSIRVPSISLSVKIEGEPRATDQHLSRTSVAQNPLIRSPSLTASRGGGSVGDLLPTNPGVDRELCALLILLRPLLTAIDPAALV